MVLSDGELSTREHIESDEKLSYDAGAGARLYDIPADAGKGFGVFEDLHGKQARRNLPRRSRSRRVSTTATTDERWCSTSLSIATRH